MRTVMNQARWAAPSSTKPRSVFDMSVGHKTTFNCDYLIPFFLNQDVLPGDTISLTPALFARMNTPIYPLMDNMVMDYHFFFVPYRQIWDNSRKFFGERIDPDDSIDFTVPQSTSPGGGYGYESLQDYLGIPPGVANAVHSSLPLRAYNHIYNEWYRDQNLIDSAVVDTNDSADTVTDYVLRKRGKRHDYFTSALTSLQKGDAVSLPLGTRADIVGVGTGGSPTYSARTILETGGNSTASVSTMSTAVNAIFLREDPDNLGYPLAYADLSNATAATINDLRLAFQTQALLELDARSGSRYSEIVASHFGVDFLDVTYRPEFLGGGSVPVVMNQVPQTSETNTTEQGNLAAFATIQAQGGGFTKSFTEHGIVMGILSVRADLTYQQGLDRGWSRETRYDFYHPILANIGEQAIEMRELYLQDDTQDTGSTGTPDNDRVFGYAERWSEYRHSNSKISGNLRSSASGSLDSWHASESFSSLPSLNQTFIEQNTPMARIVAVPSESHFTLDTRCNVKHARVMPTYSVPGMMGRF